MEHLITASPEKQRLFFGIAVDLWRNELSRIQDSIKHQLQKQSRLIVWHPPESLHITLVFLGDTNIKKKIEIEQLIQQSLSEFPVNSIEIKVTKLTLLSGRHIIIAFDAPQLNKLYERLNAAIPKNDKLKKERAYYAHLALGKLKDTHIASDVYKVLDFIKLNSLSPISIQEFYLYQSKPRRQYEPLIAYSLSGKKSKNLINLKCH